MGAKIPNTFRRKNGNYYLCCKWPVELIRWLDLSSDLIRFSLKTKDEAQARSRVALIRTNFYVIIELLNYLRRYGCLLSNEASLMMHVASFLKDPTQEYLNLVMDEFDYEGVAELTKNKQDDSSLKGAPENSFEFTSIVVDRKASCPAPSVRIPENKIIIEEYPDGRKRTFSDLTDQEMAIQELLDYDSKRSGFAGGGSSGTNNPKGPTLEEVAEKFKVYKTKEGWGNERTYSTGVRRLERVLDMLGRTKDITRVKRRDLLNVRDQLRECYEPNRKRRTPKDGKMAADTAKSHMQICKALFEYAADEEIIESNIAADVFLRLSAGSNGKTSYLPYMSNEIKSMLAGYVYTSPELPRQRDLIDAYFWQPLIAMFSGARVGELSQLTIGDIDAQDILDDEGNVVDKIWYFWLNDEEMAQVLKTESSRREVPIHSAILNAGFLEFVALRKLEEKENPSRPLFLSSAKSNDLNAKRVVGRWFNGETGYEGYLDKFAIKNRDRKCFHSFRHTCVRKLRKQKFDNESIAATVGHEPSSMTGKYGDGFELETLKEIIEHLDYGVNLSHIHFSNYLPYQQCKGQPIKNSHLALTRTKRTLPKV